MNVFAIKSQVHEEARDAIYRNIFGEDGLENSEKERMDVIEAGDFGEAQEIHPDEDEMRFGAKCLKMKPADALKNMKNFINERKHNSDEASLLQCYFTFRDYKILEYFLKHN